MTVQCLLLLILSAYQSICNLDRRFRFSFRELLKKPPAVLFLTTSLTSLHAN